MPTMVTVRPARPEDAGVVLAAYEWLFEPPGARPPGWDVARAGARFQRTVSSDRSTLLLAESDGVVAGFVSIYLDLESIRFGQRAWIEDLAVHPAHRSQRIGQRLLEAARHWARERGADRISLESGEARVDAHRFYMREAPDWRSRSFGWNLTDM